MKGMKLASHFKAELKIVGQSYLIFIDSVQISVRFSFLFAEGCYQGYGCFVSRCFELLGNRFYKPKTLGQILMIKMVIIYRICYLTTMCQALHCAEYNPMG